MSQWFTPAMFAEYKQLARKKQKGALSAAEYTRAEELINRFKEDYLERRG